ncbi:MULTISPECIES: 2-polyprenyl-3-methyl-6-methoxy-1,4-benzoquinone monooxygenase [Candidatus Ichthyocystis]|uniref:2-polyprenyl-3-methyl-6-methoxy-1,4-benzoquinone monooxygenase n=1 Tax=Candidatus Ichthyocystis TaxID=2929841 RepID=UPI000ADEFF31|nr:MULTISPECIES: 2-polyprenyl-3-methyl-6-methoxy-1,4-benzoquinone monooxygenase [Ichthyocystis]
MERLIVAFDSFLRTVTGTTNSTRQPYSRSYSDSDEISSEQRRKSINLLRINHVGEVCAQGLYQGQILSSCTHGQLRDYLLSASLEEFDHLSWCLSRLYELGGRPSMLLPLWFTSSFFIGLFAGCCGDSWSLGFLEETEKQVARHLSEHLEALSDQDPRSAEIFSVMKKEEEQHQEHARLNGARELPTPIKKIMWCMSRVMVFISPLI